MISGAVLKLQQGVSRPPAYALGFGWINGGKRMFVCKRALNLHRVTQAASHLYVIYPDPSG